MAVKKNLSPLRVGNSRTIKVTIKDKITKAAIDVTGDKFYFTIKEDSALPDTDALLQSSVVAPVDANSTAGIIFIPVTTTQTSAVSFKVGNHEYDIVWLKVATDPGPPIGRDTVQQGNIDIEQAVTRAQS